jgi:integrase
MDMKPCKLTEPIVAAMPYAPAGDEYRVADTDQKGFYVRVTSDSRTFVAQASVNGKTRGPVSLGRFEDGMKVADARNDAALRIAAWRKGVEVRPTAIGGATLREALEDYLSKPGSKGGKKIVRKASTVQGYRDILNRHTPAEWWDMALSQLTPKMVDERHSKIGTDSGNATADQWARYLRAVYERFDRTHPQENLPKNPVKAIDFYRPPARRDVITWDALPDWWKAVEALSPIRRDCWKMLLLTGLRSNACSQLKWKEIDLDNGTLTIPAERMKGGKEFVVPLSRYVRDMLTARKENNARDFGGADRGYVFPTTDRNGDVRAIENISQQGYSANGDKIRLLPGPQVLRRTFNTVATDDVKIPDAHRMILVDHSMPYSGVNGKHYYGRMSDDPIRDSLERVTTAILRGVGVEYGEPKPEAKADTADATKQAEALLKAFGPEVIAKLAAMVQQGKGAA